MASDKQIAANRRNAQHSTGPQTPAAKAPVRSNALKHGLTSDNAVIEGEDEEAFDELLNTFLDDLQPASPVETALVHQVVMAQWRLARCRALETGFFNLRLVDHKRDLEADYTNLIFEDKLAHVFRRDACPPPSVLDTLGRYEARIERAFYRALHELQRIQAARKANSVEQSQSTPKPLPERDLTPPVGQAVPPAQVSSPSPVGQAVPPAPDLRPPLTTEIPPGSDQITPCPPGACC